MQLWHVSLCAAFFGDCFLQRLETGEVASHVLLGCLGRLLQPSRIATLHIHEDLFSAPVGGVYGTEICPHGFEQLCTKV